nr:hypothetical protein [Candidatus Sigynarchaeota archaeon]
IERGLVLSSKQSIGTSYIVNAKMQFTKTPLNSIFCLDLLTNQDNAIFSELLVNSAGTYGYQAARIVSNVGTNHGQIVYSFNNAEWYTYRFVNTGASSTKSILTSSGTSFGAYTFSGIVHGKVGIHLSQTSGFARAIGKVDVIYARVYTASESGAWLANAQDPVLSGGGVSPGSGIESTLFNFTVTYSDADDQAPAFVRCVINGTSYPMVASNPGITDYHGGVNYELATYLDLGDHSFYFEASDTARVGTTGNFPGPTVSRVNSANPTLVNLGVVPPIGAVNQSMFTFSVNYTDADNNAPEIINVTVNGTTFPLAKLDPLDMNVMDGCIYQGSTTLPSLGQYSYLFDAYDGGTPVSIGPYPGPTGARHGYDEDFEDDTVGASILTDPDWSLLMAGMEPVVTVRDGSNQLYFLDTSATLLFWPGMHVNAGSGTSSGWWVEFKIEWISGRAYFCILDGPDTSLDRILMLQIGNQFDTVTGELQLRSTLSNYSLDTPTFLTTGIQYLIRIEKATSTPDTYKIYVNDVLVEDNGTCYYTQDSEVTHLAFSTAQPYYDEEFYIDDIYCSWSNIYSIFDAELLSGSVSPATGNQSTTFNFTVNYRDLDNQPPVYMGLVINGTYSTMAKVNPLDVDYTDGVLYTYQAMLPVGTYEYYFRAYDGFFPVITSNLSLTVMYTNVQSPELLNPMVTPGQGINTTVFNFTVVYYDLDNNMPVDINITINGTTYPMLPAAPADTSAMDGKLYYFT